MHIPPSLPETGFVRLPQILAVLPVCESSWWAGVKTGIYPRGVLHGRRRLWSVEEIRELLQRIHENGAGDV